MIAPLALKVEDVYPFEVQIAFNGTVGKVLLDQVHSISKESLQAKISSIDEESKKLVDKALKVALSL